VVLFQTKEAVEAIRARPMAKAIRLLWLMSLSSKLKTTNSLLLQVPIGMVLEAFITLETHVISTVLCRI
jgi:hypothetical protein